MNKQGAEAVLFAGLSGTAFAVLVSGAEVSGVETIAQQFLQVGAPSMLGAAVAVIVGKPFKTGNKTPLDYLMRGAIAGAAGTIVLIAAGALPAVFDTQLVTFVGLVGASAIVGEALANAVEL